MKDASLLQGLLQQSLLRDCAAFCSCACIEKSRSFLVCLTFLSVLSQGGGKKFPFFFYSKDSRGDVTIGRLNG